MDSSRMQTSEEQDPNFDDGSVWAGVCTTSSPLSFAHDGAEIIDAHITPCFRVVQPNQWQRSHVSDVPTTVFLHNLRTRFFTYINPPINQSFWRSELKTVFWLPCIHLSWASRTNRSAARPFGIMMGFVKSWARADARCKWLRSRITLSPRSK